MKIFMENNKGNIIITVLCIVLGIAIGLAFYGTFHEAQAILGESGNVSTEPGHPHNFASTSSGINASTDLRICIFCHTSHGAINNSTENLYNAPLWNHTLSSALYNVLSPSVIDSETALGNSIGGIVNMVSSPGAPDGASRLCLSCHDGTVAIGDVASEQFPIAMNTADACLDASGKLNPSCSAYIGNDLTQKHVVSIAMNDNLVALSNSNCGDAGQTTYVKYPWDAPDSQASVVLLRPTGHLFQGSTPGVQGLTKAGMPASKYSSSYSYGVQCSTCHDPHQWVDTTNDQVAGYKLLVTGFDSLCQACHAICL